MKNETHQNLSIGMTGQREQIEKLSALIGTWKGRGVAEFPTIETTQYFEELKFSFVEIDPAIYYEQKTWFIDNDQKGAPLHFEFGFILPKDNGIYEMNNAQKNGRTEVLSGNLSMFSGNTFHLALQSKSFSNDDRMIRSGRDFYIDGNALKYYVNMATQKTPEFRNHLEAELKKV
jgi:hypothetical protein